MKHSTLLLHAVIKYMYGINFETVMNTLLMEVGYSVVTSNMGFTTQELLEIADWFMEYTSADVDKFLLRNGISRLALSERAILDHYFKVDTCLQLPSKEVVGIQWFSYNKFQKETIESQRKINFKKKQLLTSYEACGELFIDRTYVVAAYVPKSWKGLGLRTPKQKEIINLRILNLVSQMVLPQREPEVLHFTLE